jgi:hypothetical protein
MTSVTIHYQSPANEPFSIPSPHMATISQQGALIDIIGGHIGPLTRLIGFTAHELPIDFRNEAVWFSASRWLSTLAPGEHMPMTGWYAVFLTAEGIPFTYPHRIERIEVSE